MSSRTSHRAIVLGTLVALASVAPIAVAQNNAKGAPGSNANPVAASQAQAMPHGIVPNRAELSASAFQKLDSENKGYVTLNDVTQLQGFETAFRQADQNRDGRLNPSEFSSAWAIYTGNTP